jgi:hypothetical protein
MVIYRCTNINNGKVYIGKTILPLALRWRQHVLKARNPKSHFHRAIRKHGSDVFSVEPIYLAQNLVELNRMETFFIILHQSHVADNGYNGSLGGDGGDTFS